MLLERDDSRRTKETYSRDVFLEARPYSSPPVKSNLRDVVVPLPRLQLVPEPTEFAAHEKLQPLLRGLLDLRVPSLCAIPFAATSVMVEVAVIIIVLVRVISSDCDTRT